MAAPVGFVAGIDLGGTKILGRVLDQTGSVIADAKVSATNTATAVRYTSTSNGSGDYILPFLIPGEYSVTVESKGFRTSNRAGTPATSCPGVVTSKRGPSWLTRAMRRLTVPAAIPPG